MKNKLIIILLILSFTYKVNAAQKFEVKFKKCVDGDTAKFEYKNETITARFLAIDTPETKHPTKKEQPFGKEASNYTCNKLQNAAKIELEYDDDSDKTDKYNRYLVWVWVDNNLLQKELIKNGLASVAYLYGDYKYTNELKTQEQIAEEKKIGIWSTDETEENTIIEYKHEIIIAVIILLIIFILFPKSRKKIINKLLKSIK